MDGGSEGWRLDVDVIEEIEGLFPCVFVGTAAGVGDCFEVRSGSCDWVARGDVFVEAFLGAAWLNERARRASACVAEFG